MVRESKVECQMGFQNGDRYEGPHAATVELREDSLGGFDFWYGVAHVAAPLCECYGVVYGSGGDVESVRYILQFPDGRIGMAKFVGHLEGDSCPQDEQGRYVVPFAGFSPIQFPTDESVPAEELFGAAAEQFPVCSSGPVLMPKDRRQQPL